MILAVIALIATPIIMNVINDSKVGAAKDAMYGYVKAVELATTKTITATTDAPSGEYQVTDGNLYQGNTKLLDIAFKGTKPANNYGKMILASGTVTYAKLKFDGIEVEYDGSKVRSDNFLKNYIIGEEVYFDPTGAVADCASGKEWTPSNTGTTCYKWNVIKDNENTVEMLLDHNTTAKIAWNSSGSNENGPLEVYNQLKTDTNGWNRVETLTSSDNVTRNNASGGTYSINYNGMKARFISGSEVAYIIKNTSWNGSGSYMTITSEPWLYQNTRTHNDGSNQGYWTDTTYELNTTNAWHVYYEGTLSHYLATDGNYFGIRPVVRVLKSTIA